MNDEWLPPAKRPRQDCVGSLDAMDLCDKSSQAFPNSWSGLECSAEGLGQMKEFQVLDEVGSDDPDNVRVAEADSDDSKIPAGEVERMLDERLPEDLGGPLKGKEEGIVVKHKTVLDVKGQQYLEALPLDWVMATHTSGVPVYLHKGLRVCTLARPYFLGEGSVRRHEIPISAIPCLAYRKALDEEEKQNEFNNEEVNKTNLKREKTCPFNGKESKDTTVEKVDYSMDITDDICSDVKNMSEMSTATIGTSRGPTKDEMHCSSSGGPTEDEMHRSSSGGLTKDEMHLLSAGTPTKDEMHRSSSGGPTKDEMYRSSSGGPTKDEMDRSSSGGPTKDEMHLLSAGTPTNDEIHLLSAGTPTKDEMHLLSAGTPTKDETVANQETTVSDEAAKPSDTEIPSGKKPALLPGGHVLPATCVVLDKWRNHTLTHEQVTEYCRKLFIFKDISYRYFKEWSQRRQYLKDRKSVQRPKLPAGPKLVSLPLPDASCESTGQGVRTGKTPLEWTLNMNERGYVNMLHEYLMHVMHKTPKYEFRVLESSATPFEATVVIDGIRYGVGEGSSKKQAKLNAARETMVILVPEMKEHIEEGGAAKRERNDSNMEFFDMIGIEDPRLTEYCRTAVQPLPRSILTNCIRRNFGATGSELQYKWTKVAYNKIEYHMSVGKHEVAVTCKSNKMGKHLASQALLQVLHPHIKSYGSLLRMYGAQSWKACSERRQEELEDDTRDRQPNYALLERLRRDIENLGKRDASAEPVGTLVLSDAPPTLSGSALNDIDF